MTVEADGTVHAVTPTTAVVALVGQEVTSCCSTGPASDVCTQMPFLSSPAAGRTWLEGRRGVTVVDLDDARQIALAYAGTGQQGDRPWP